MEAKKNNIFKQTIVKTLQMPPSHLVIMKFKKYLIIFFIHFTFIFMNLSSKLDLIKLGSRVHFYVYDKIR